MGSRKVHEGDGRVRNLGVPVAIVTDEGRPRLATQYFVEFDSRSLQLAQAPDSPRLIYGPLLQLRRIIHASPFSLPPFLEENGIAVRRGAPPVTKLLYPR